MLKKIALFLGFGLAGAAHAQTADQGWLEYGQISGGQMGMPFKIRGLGTGAGEQAAVEELERYLKACCEQLRGVKSVSLFGGTDSFDGETVVGTVEGMSKAYPELAVPVHLRPGGYWTYVDRAGGQNRVLIAGADQAGVVYGAFAFMRYRRVRTG